MTYKAFVFQVGSGLQLFEVSCDTGKVVGSGELGNGDGESYTIQVSFGSEGSGSADVDDPLRIGFGFDE